MLTKTSKCLLLLLINYVKLHLTTFNHIHQILQANADYGKMVAEMEKNEHAFDVNAPGERP